MTAFHRGARWISFTKTARPIIAASLPQPCVNAGAHPSCTGIVQPGEVFDVSHRRDHHLDPFQSLDLSMVGPAHRKCNRTAGAKAGRAKQLAKQRGDQRLPDASSGW